MLTTPVSPELGTRTGRTRVSSSPSKILYGGFSPVRLQTGIPPRPSSTTGDLSARPASPHPRWTYTRLKSKHPVPVARLGMYDETRSRNDPVQRPLALQRVVLSHRVTAYYGLMRDSRPLPPIYGLDDGSWPSGLLGAGAERFPNLLHMSRSSVPPSLPRRTERLLLAVSSPSTLAFTAVVTVRHPQVPPRRFPRGQCNEAAKFALCCGPEDFLVLHRQGRLRSSFHLLRSPPRASNITTRANQPIPAAGLSPARHAALWAANNGPRTTEQRLTS